MANNESGQLLTVAEVAERLRLHPITVRRHIKAGRIRAVRIGRAVRVPEAELRRFAGGEAVQRSRIGEEVATYRAKSPERLAHERRLRETTPEEWEQRRKAVDALRQLRDKKGGHQEGTQSSRMTTTEIVRQERRMLARKHDRWRRPFDEMRRLRDQMSPMDISTADLVRAARSAREWMYEDDDE
jgi:excisionase family DNA binding protein